MIDEERQPLLGSNDSAPHHQSGKGCLSYTSIWAAVRDKWPIYRVLLVALLVYTSTVGPVTTVLELTRALACAEYYQHHPPSQARQSALQSSDSEKLCSNDWIEGRSAQAYSTINVVGSMLATASILLIEPHLSRWGRKRVFIFSTSVLLLDRTVSLFLPIGYPYGPTASQMAVSPEWVMRIFLGFSILANMFGGEIVPILCLRLIITDASSAGSKTTSLLGLQRMNIISVSVGPVLTTWLGSLFPVSSGSMIRLFSRIGDQFQRLGMHTSPSSGPVPVPLLPRERPLPPISPGMEQNNVAPFLVSLLTVIATIITSAVILPADEACEASPSSLQQDSPPKERRESMFWRIWPRRDIDGNRDWRILAIIVVAMCHMGSAYSSMIYIQFFGHALHWGQEATAFLISSMGITRAITLFLVAPLWTAYFERTIKRPGPLRQLSLDEIKAIAEEAPAVDAPIESTSEIRPTGRQGDSSSLSVDPYVIRGAIATWRARIDRSVLGLSWTFDILGWFSVALFTMIGNATAIFVGGIIVALGAAGMPVRMGADLVIVCDVLARTNESPDKPAEPDPISTATSGHVPPSSAEGSSVADVSRTHAHPAVQARADELYFPLIGFFESLSTFLSPVVATEVYKRTLSTFPAANWLLCAALYVIAATVHYSMPVHKRSPT